LFVESTRPKTMRQMVVPANILGFLKELRKTYPHLSKYKLKPFLDVWCDEKGLSRYSVSWIGKVLSHYQLFFGKRKTVTKKRQHPRSGYRIHHCPSALKVPLGYLQLDGVKVYWNGEKCLFLSALEVKTRKAWVKRVPTLSSLQAKIFLTEIIQDFTHPISFIHTDNGSEFKAVFDDAVVDLKLTHLWGPPRTPKVQAHVERFNRTLQEEFVDYHIDTAITEPEIFQHQLTDWLTWYNTKRPHQALSYLTPQEYLLHLQQSASTQNLKCP
jgi:transposase InsO family protein